MIPHSFQDQGLRKLALTHSSTAAAADNERLEFLGDAALDLIVAEELFREQRELPEGELTVLKSSVVSRRTLAEAARRMQLAEEAEFGAGLSQRTVSRSVQANLYEAVLGAVYLDGGLEAARNFVRTTLAEPLARTRERRWTHNPKQLLQEYCQRYHGNPPSYAVLENRGLAHARAFLVRATTEGRSYPAAWGRTRKEAEQWAAYEALLVIAESLPE